jgi:hypothetical protein
MKHLIFIILFSSCFLSAFGQEIDRIIAVPEEKIAYEIFIPNNYKGEAAIFFFDRYGNGCPLIDMYRDIANQYSVALIGLNNVMMGSEEDPIDLMKKTIAHSEKKFLPQIKHIYLSGFSTTARIATLYAYLNPRIKGVIGCGAGFSSDVKLEWINFKYVGLVGVMDMNYQEMIENEALLNGSNRENLIVEFYGDHSWPTVENFNVAVSWLLQEKDEVIANHYMAFTDSLKSAENLVSQTRLQRRFSYMVNSPSEKQASKSKEFKKQQKLIEKITTKELNRQSEILNAFSDLQMSEYYEPTELKSSDWWSTLIKQVNKELKKDGLKRISAIRTKTLIREVAFERGFYTLNSNLDLAEEFFEIYNQASDDSWYSIYWLAKCKALKGDWQAFEKLFRKSVDQGFDAFDYIQDVPVLSHQKAQEIISGLIAKN